MCEHFINKHLRQNLSVLFFRFQQTLRSNKIICLFGQVWNRLMELFDYACKSTVSVAKNFFYLKVECSLVSFQLLSVGFYDIRMGWQIPTLYRMYSPETEAQWHTANQKHQKWTQHLNKQKKQAQTQSCSKSPQAFCSTVGSPEIP